MAKKKSYEFRESKQYNRNSDGLKQRRLKNEARWKYSPNSEYGTDDVFDDDNEWFQDPEFDRR